jgi:2-(1,2-epoxy-1,2-dihydrophenyl)acetyl-CoA isomerase
MPPMNLISLKFRVEDGLARITLAQGERGNPFDSRFARELRLIAEACSDRADIRAILFDAEGRYFSVGGDLNVLAKDRAMLPDFAAATIADLNAAISTFARLDAPMIASVHGTAAGGALGLVSGCDFILAAPEARFAAAFAGIGISADSGSSWHMPRKVGTRRATEFFLLNEAWTAAEALANGLINRVVLADVIAAESLELARRLAAGPTRAYGQIRRLLAGSLMTPLDAHLAREAEGIDRTIRTDDAWSAINAVLAKQPVRFKGA